MLRMASRKHSTTTSSSAISRRSAKKARFCRRRANREMHSCDSIKVRTSEKLTVGALALVPLPPVILNALIIPFVLYYGYGFKDAFGYTGTAAVLGLDALTVGAGEAAVCYVIGVPLMIFVHKMLKKSPDLL